MPMAFPILTTITILLLFLLLPLVVLSQSPQIPLNSKLIASETSTTWKSPSREFAFGFHSIENNRSHFLLGIWFDNIPDKNLVWYATNGNSPALAPKGSKLELTSDGRFLLTSTSGQVLWNPESFVNGVAYAAMLNSGNFILADNKSSYIWESFKDPRDTILISQTIEPGGMLSSRLNENNYSRGRFQLRLLPNDGNVVLNPIALPTQMAYDAYYWSDTYSKDDEMIRGDRIVFNESGYLYVVRKNGSIKNLTSGNVVSPKDYYYRATLDPDGVFTQYAYPRAPRNGSSERSWFSVWHAPEDICSNMNGDLGGGSCGFNSYCTLDQDGKPICTCLPGFSLSDPNDKFSGCKQDTSQNCEPGRPNPEDIYDMHAQSNVVWPTSANYEGLQPSDEDYCRRSCLYDCNCVVAVSNRGTCWKKKLPLSHGRINRSIYGKAFVKVAKYNISSGKPPSWDSNLQNNDQSRTILVIAILLGGSVFVNFLFMASSSIFVLYFYHKRQKVTGVSSILETNPRNYSYQDLKEATNGFKEELGKGAFGTVYKGVLPISSSNILVAIKQLENVAKDGEKEFKTEASAIASTHHKNLVKLLGFCDEGPHKLLVYEFMSNGTLASFLFGISRPDWNKRVQMAFGIARGLTYLHEECSTQIIHCDIKPQNILLDDTFTARISDFGLAKLLLSEQTRTNTMIRGTRGYVAPEWFRNMPITAKVDVYSYGVMLLEIICCRKSLELERENQEEAILSDWAYDCYREGRLDKLVVDDEEARNEIKKVERLVMVAIWCIQEDPSLRPSMRMVTQMLEGVAQVSVPPCPFPFSSVC